MYKYRYRILGIILLIEYLVLEWLGSIEIKVESFSWNAIGAFICLLPIAFLVYFASIDAQKTMVEKCLQIFTSNDYFLIWNCACFSDD